MTQARTFYPFRALLAALSLAVVSSPRTASADDEKQVYVCPPCGCKADDITFDKPGECPECKMGLVERKPKREPRKVAMLLFEGFEILDFAGPAEVFSSASGSNGREFEVFTVSSSTEDVESRGAVMMVKPEYTLEKCPKPDIVVIPGGRIDSVTQDEKLMAWIKARASDSEIVMSVCNGAFALHKAGLLDGLEATTHHGSVEHLRRVASKTKVVPDRRYVDNGKIITAAGVSAGIDAALHVVERLLGPEAANHTARYMEYNRNPEVTTVGR